MLGCLAFAFAGAPVPHLDLEPDAARRRTQKIRARFREGPARALGPGAVVVAAPQFLWVSDVARSLPAAPWTTDGAYAEMFEMVRGAWEAREPDGARTLIVFATFEAGDQELFYTALSNDVLGLGEGDEAAIFDQSPGSALEGYAWMGSLEGLDAAGPYFATEAFLHEIAHRWGIFVRVTRPDLPADVLLGRNQTHFSFLADTNNSPMEGNRWRQVSDDRWSTRFDEPPRFQYTPLELYLMGLIPPSEVPPMRVLGRLSAVEPTWFRANAATPPAHRIGLEVSARTESISEVTIAEIIAASGPRRPAAPTQATEIVRRIAIVLLSDGRAEPTPARLRDFGLRVQGWLRAFADATGGRMTLSSHVSSAGRQALGTPCADLDSCDRTEADQCLPSEGGRQPICTRYCAIHTDCGNLCCVGKSVPGLCGPPPPGSSCGPAPGDQPDAGSGPSSSVDASQTSSGMLTPPTPGGCRNGTTRAPAALILSGLWLISVRRRRCPGQIRA